jgi:small ligand-binding sensory domain FIST
MFPVANRHQVEKIALMKFVSALTTHVDWTEAVEDLTRQVHTRLPNGRADLVLLFLHPRFTPHAQPLAEQLRINLAAHHLVGCTGAGIIGVNVEVENLPAISLLAAELPEVNVTPFRVTQEELEEASGPSFWHFLLQTPPTQKPNFLLFADPFSLPSIPLVQAISEAYPDAPLIGGLASGAQHPGENRIFLDGDVFEDGAVGIALSGRITLRTIVSQGCRPIGEPFTVTRAEKNIVFELGGQPPLNVLQSMLPNLPQTDQQLVRTSLLIGRVINEYKEDFGRGDFLVRTLIGHDPQSGAVAIGDLMRTGQTVQFQVRDAKSADEDLRALLAQEALLPTAGKVRGAVLFSCLGRGEGMYGTSSHDIKLLHEYFSPLPTTGFFCNGEIGPVGGRAFVHGFTSVVGLFAEP